MEKKSKAYRDRVKIYESVEKIYAYNNRFGTQQKSIYQVSKMPILAKVYLIFLIKAHSLKDYKKSSMLYDSTTYLYLDTFKRIRDGQPYNRQLLTKIHTAHSMVKNCVNVIKSDQPHLFDYDLIQEAKKRRKNNKIV